MRPGILLVGGGGHCRSVIDVLEAAAIPVAGVVDRAGRDIGDVLGYPVLGTDDDLPRLVRDHPFALVTIGQIETPGPRKRLAVRLKALGFVLPTLVSPQARVSRHATIGEGTVVHHFAVINAGARVGANCIINTRALIEHDVVVGDFCHISTAAVVNGGASVGDGTFCGSGVLCRDNTAIGANCFVAMGELVVRPLSPGRRLPPHLRKDHP